MNKELIKNKLLIEISNGRESLNQKIREWKKERETGVNWRRKKKKKERKKEREKREEKRKKERELVLVVGVVVTVREVRPWPCGRGREPVTVRPRDGVEGQRWKSRERKRDWERNHTCSRRTGGGDAPSSTAEAGRRTVVHSVSEVFLLIDCEFFFFLELIGNFMFRW